MRGLLPMRDPRPAPDPARQIVDQALKPRGSQAANQPTMIPRLARIKILTDHDVGPCPVPLAARIFHDDVGVARGAERYVQPGDFLLEAEPFRVDRHRREKGHGCPQPRDSHPYLVHRLGIARARAAVTRRYPGDAIPCDPLECRCAIEARRCRRDLAPAIGRLPSSGRFGSAGPHHLPSRNDGPHIKSRPGPSIRFLPEATIAETAWILIDLSVHISCTPAL